MGFVHARGGRRSCIVFLFRLGRGGPVGKFSPVCGRKPPSSFLFPPDLRYTSAEIEKTPQTLCICPCETFLSFPRVICRRHVITCLKTAHFLVIFGDHAGHANFCASRLSDPGFYYFLLHDKEVIGEHGRARIRPV